MFKVEVRTEKSYGLYHNGDIYNSRSMLKIKSMYDRTRDDRELHVLLSDIAKSYIEHFKDNLLSGKHKQPDGSRWKELSEKRQKAREKEGLIRDRPMLVGSDRNIVDGHRTQMISKYGIVITNDCKYAAYHLTGADRAGPPLKLPRYKKKPPKRHDELVKTDWKLPKRDWMHVTEAKRSQTEGIIMDWIEGKSIRYSRIYA